MVSEHVQTTSGDPGDEYSRTKVPNVLANSRAIENTDATVYDGAITKPTPEERIIASASEQMTAPRHGAERGNDMADMTKQEAVSRILKEFEAGAVRYRDHEISLLELSDLEIPLRLSKFIQRYFLREPEIIESQKLLPEQILDADIQTLRRSLKAMMTRFLEPEVDHAYEMGVMTACIIKNLCLVLPDSEAEIISDFITLSLEKHQTDDCRDPDIKARELEDLGRRARDVATQYLQTFAAEPKSEQDA